MSWVLAVDGGNTKTLAAVAGADGVARGVGRAGCSDIYNAPTPEQGMDEMEAAARQALAAAGVTPDAIGAAAFSLAGADWPEDFALLEPGLRDRLGLAETPLVVNDALGALRTGSPDWTGIAVVSGTYNAVGARNARGEVFHLGFWPDGAGGRNIARAGLKAIYRAALDMGPATALGERAFALYGVRDAIGLLYEFTRRGGLEDPDKDRLAPVVLDLADGGDAVSQAIVADAGRVLGIQARATAAQIEMPLEGTRIVLTGRVFEHPTDRLAAATMAELPGAVPVRGGPPPIAGALMLAYDRLGITVDLSADDGRSARWAA